MPAPEIIVAEVKEHPVKLGHHQRLSSLEFRSAPYHHGAMSARAEQEVLLAELLKPTPTLPPNVLLAILAAVATINLAFMVGFVLRGAWPVAPFMGADVVLLAWAFRQSRIASRREEEITLTRSALRIARRPLADATPDVVLNPHGVRVEMGDPQTENQLTLWSHGKGVRVGAFLAPFERTSFANRLKAALWRAKTIPVEARNGS